MCLIESCGRKPIAKKLCALHYMRLRRGGDPLTVSKPGRKRSPERLLMEKMEVSTEWSPRTFARFRKAMELLQAAECDIKPSIKAALRSNGKLNVSRLLETAFKRYIVRYGRVSQSEAQRLWKFWKSTH